MAKIKEKDLERLPLKEIKEFFNSPTLIKTSNEKLNSYLNVENDVLSNRLVRVETLFKSIIFKRFLKNKL